MIDLFESYWKSLPTDLFTSQSKGSKARGVRCLIPLMLFGWLAWVSIVTGIGLLILHLF